MRCDVVARARRCLGPGLGIDRAAVSFVSSRAMRQVLRHFRPIISRINMLYSGLIARDVVFAQPRGSRVLTVDEELSHLDDILRRLKVEYDVFFGGGVPKPPLDLDWRVQSLIKKFSDTQKLNFSQRYKYNSIAERYARFSDLWRQKLRIKEEGYRRPEDAMLAIQGLRTEQERQAARALRASKTPPLDPEENFALECSDIDREIDNVRLLFDFLVALRRRLGEPELKGSFEGFLMFMKMKTDQIRREFNCERVEYRIELREGRVRLSGRPKTVQSPAT